jgi:predicted permease
MNAFFLRLKSLLHRRRMNRELAEELDFHQTLLRQRLVREGTAPAELDHATRQAFGNRSRWHERLRELWQFRTLENFLRDLRFSARLLQKAPGFTAVALLTLAIGVGANTAVFSLINGLLLRPLPVPHGEQLAVLRIEEGGPEPNYEFCTPFFRSLEQRHDVFSDVFAYNADLLQVKAQSGSENIHGMLVSGQFFRALQTPPLLGRYLTPEDDRRGGPSGLAVVISESFWQNWFHRAPDVIGRKLVIANVPFTVVGVMPKRFIGADPTSRPQIYAPLAADPIIDAPRNHIDDGIHAWWLTVGARLQPGVALEQANASLAAISNPILHDTAGDAGYIADEEKGHFHFAAEPGSRGFTFARIFFRKPLLTMFLMCAGILLLACLNLASLLMARGAARERELATRLAIGATRRRLIQQMLVESLLLALLGTAAGITAASLISSSLAALLMSGAPDGVQLDTTLDGRVFAFAAGIAVVASLLIGLMPALQATAGNLNDHIKDGQHGRQTQERRKLLPRFLMAFEVALALVLVVGAGLLATSLLKLFRSGAGFDAKGLINLRFTMDKQPLEGDPLMRLYQQLDEGLSHQPGVKSASLQFIVPLAHRGWNGRYGAPSGPRSLLYMNSVAPKYFSTMRIPLYNGREFSWADTSASGLKIILNQSAANLLFPGQRALGQQVMNFDDKTMTKSYEVVAVVGDTKYRDMRRPSPPAAYVPIQQDEQKKPSLSAVLRVDGKQNAELVSAARLLTARLAPTVPAPTFSTMEEILNQSVATERMMALLALFFAGCALLVTAIGLYGTLAYATARRTSEIGIRMALGAQRGRVLVMVFRENAVIAVAGVGAGFTASLLASRALASFLYGISARDPWVLAGSIVALTVIASLASLLPALRAARIEPMEAIRCE